MKQRKKITGFLLAFIITAGLLAGTPLAASAASGGVAIAQADTVTQIQANIQAALDAASSGDTITVTGSKTDVDARMALTIPAGVTVNWAAEYTGTVQNTGAVQNTGMIRVWGDDGIFNVTAEGSLKNSGNGQTLRIEGIRANVTIAGTVISSGSGRALYVIGANATAAITGTVSADSGSAIYVSGSGTNAVVTVDGGTVSNSATTNVQAAIYVENTNTITNVIVKNGGKVLAFNTGGYAIQTSGGVEIGAGASDTAQVNAIAGVAINASGPDARVTVNGGVVSAVSRAIHTNNAGAQITINGGIVSATTGHAVYTDYAGTSVTVNGGFVFAYGTSLTDVINTTSFAGPTGDGIVVAWDSAQTPPFTAYTQTALAIWPAGTTASEVFWDTRWDAAAQSALEGIQYAKGGNTGFFPLSHVVSYKAAVNLTDKTFPSATYGYSNSGMEQRFVITNTGTGQLTGLTAALPADSGFTISTPLSAGALGPGDTATIGIQPKNGLAAGSAPYLSNLTVQWASPVDVSYAGATELTVPLRFTVHKKAITVTANNQEKYYGKPDPALTWTVKPALIKGDTLAGSLKYTGTAAGTYRIVQAKAFSNPNYKITFVAGTMTIKALPGPNPPNPPKPQPQPPTGDSNSMALWLGMAALGLGMAIVSRWRRHHHEAE